MVLEEWAAVRDVKIPSCPCATHTCLHPHFQETPKHSLDFRKLSLKTALKMCLLVYFYIPSRVLSVLIITIRMI